MIYIPTIPTACRRAEESQFSHQGRNIPCKTCKVSGFDTKNSYPKVKAITDIKSPKNNSSFRKPYLSKNKNVNVSMIVMRTPPHNGILK